MNTRVYLAQVQQTVPQVRRPHRGIMDLLRFLLPS